MITNTGPISNTLLISVSALLVYLTIHINLVAAVNSDSALYDLHVVAHTLSPIIDQAREQAEPPIEYRTLPRSLVHIVRFRHSGYCAVSSEKGTQVADHSPYARGATYDRLGGKLCFYRPDHVLTAV